MSREIIVRGHYHKWRICGSTVECVSSEEHCVEKLVETILMSILHLELAQLVHLLRFQSTLPLAHVEPCGHLYTV